MADYVVRLNGLDNLTSTIDKAKKELNDFGKVGQTASEKIDAKFNKIINSSAPLKRLLRDLRELMAKMNLDGLSNTDQFTLIALAAGKIKDAINDAGTAILKYANDTQALLASIQAFQGLTAAGTIAAGAMSLFGSENEDAAKAILKVQGVLAILNGVQTVANTLNKDSALMLKLKQIRMVAITAATTGNTVATATNTTATVANNGAMKVWNVTKAIGKALLGDFTGLLIVGAGALAAYAIATADSSDEQSKLNDNIDKGTSFMEKQTAASKEVAKSIDAEKYQISQLISVIQNENVAYEDKVNALNQLKGIIPSVNGYISSEGTYHGNAVVAIRNHIKALDDLSKALAAFKLGQKIQEEVTTAEWDKFQADQKVNRKRNNIRADERQILKFQNNAGTYMTLREGKAANTLYGETLNRKKINETNLKAAEVEQTNADNRLKAAQRQQQEFNQFQKQNGGSIKAQTAVALANGDTNKALDLFIDRDKITSPKTGGRGGRSTGGGGGHVETQAEKDAKELSKYQTTLNVLQEQYNDKLITELDYKKKVKDAEESHLKYLFDANKATQADIDRYNKADADFTQTNIKVNYESNIDDLKQQLSDGFIDSEQYADGIADALKNVYLENLKAGTATKEMADAYKQAANEAERLKKDSEVDLLLNVTYSKKESSFDKAVNSNQVVTFDTQLNGIEDQMNFNDSLIEQLNTIKQLYEELGLTGTESYDRINAKILEATESNDKLAEQASNLNKKQKEQEKTKDIYNTISDAAQNTASVFSDLGKTADDTTLQTAGIIANAIANIIQGYSKASEQAASLGPIAWAAFSLAGLAQVTSVISQIHSLSGYAQGGIVTGGSTHGDRVLARLNAGEMVLNPRQQSNLFKAINSGSFEFGKTDNANPTINFKIKGSDLYGTLKNYSKTAAKSGRITGIQ